MPTISHVHADFNGDGRSDIFLAGPSPDNGVTYSITDWLSNSDGSFTPNSAHFSSGVGADWYLAEMGDFNGDGLTDLLWRNQNTGAMTEWLGTSTGAFNGNPSAATSVADTSWQIVGSGDFNGDGISDIIWRNASGYLTEWLGSTSGVFVQNNAIAGTGNADSNWEVVGTGDFNGDGRSDILWRNVNTGYITEWLGTMNGSFVSNEAHAGNGSADFTWTVVGTGDFNGDGITDILWRNPSSGYITEWLGTATGGFVSNQANAGNGSAGNNWSIAEIGDFNGDGRSDILWRNIGTGYITEWLGTANGGFMSIQDIAGTPLDNSWHIQNIFA